MERLRILVASSSEHLVIAMRVVALLNSPDATGHGTNTILEAHPWTDTTFTFGRTYIESLELELDRADFAVVILSASDVGWVRGQRVNLPRDNVIFEYGLFAGRLGRDRCLFFIDASSQTRVASDLSGVKEVDFVTGSDTDDGGPRDLAARCREVAVQIVRLGGRYKPSADTRALQTDRWRVANAIGGCWWSFRYWDRRRLGLVTLTPDETGPTLSVSGRAFAPDAPSKVAEMWDSVASALIRDKQKWILYYVWAGTFPSSPNQHFTGTSEYEFPDNVDYDAGRGHILEANLGDLSATQEKALELRRCTKAELHTMKNEGVQEKAELLQRLLVSWHQSV